MHSCPGCSPPFCCASRVHRGTAPERWGAMSALALGGVGGSGVPPSPLRVAASWQAPWKPMPSTRLPATRATLRRAGPHHGVARYGGAVRNGSPGGVMTTKTAPRSSPGSATRGVSSSTRPATSPYRPSRRRGISPSQPAVGCTPTRPAALGLPPRVCHPHAEGIGPR